MYAMLTHSSKKPTPVEAFREVNSWANASPLGYYGDADLPLTPYPDTSDEATSQTATVDSNIAATASASPISLLFVAANGATEVTATAQVTPALGITANIVSNGTTGGHDAGVTNPFAPQPLGPFGMGAARAEVTDLKQIAAMGAKFGAPKLGTKDVIQVNTAPNAPNHTFPDGKPNTSSFLADYQAYYFQFQAGGQQYYWVLAPYAITFTLPGNDPKQYSFTIREQKTITAGTNQPVKLPLQTVYLDEKAMDPTKANIGKDGSALSWGLVTPPGGGPQVAQVVLTDTPSFPGLMSESFKEEATLQVIATNGAGVSQRWDYTLSLTCGGGQPPVFKCSQPKEVQGNGP